MTGKRPPQERTDAVADESTTASVSDGTANPRFDVRKVEGFIPIEQLKNGWTFPEYDPDNPDHERFVHLFAELLLRVRERKAAERKARADADAIAAEPKFVRVHRTSKKAHSRTRRSARKTGRDA